ncbi:hypothetical protein [Anatilimnocola floriformis]|uniref:hypothetical protein n=1 Tax=Anatilimnocola floriformis TaxID=2948575 RepID=UPI0020C4E24E|nr:hypothetical protein [Anatilimnocola floriformis]
MRLALFLAGAWFALAHLGVSAAESTPELRDTAGNRHRFDRIHDKSAKATVFVFLDDNCPDANRYVDTLRKLHDRYNAFEMDRRGKPIRKNAEGKWEHSGRQGDAISFIGVYSRGPFLSIREIARHALRQNIPFRVMHDAEQELMTKFGVTNYTEVRVWDPQAKRVIYSGPIDDQYQRGAGKPEAKNLLLQEVLDRIVAGEKVDEIDEPVNSGCPIPKLADAQFEPFTFYEDIEPILQRRCQECHREGGAGPFELMSLRDLQDHAEIIDQVVHDRTMPPFPGDSPHELEHDRRLTKDEWYKLISWLRGERKLGDRAKRPAPREFSQTKEWQIGKPDFVAKMGQPFQVPKDGIVDYVYVPIRVPDEVREKYGHDGKLYVQAIESRPGAHPQVVHHIQVHEYHGKINEATQSAAGGGAAVGLNALDLLFMYGPSILGARRLGGYEPGDPDNARTFDPQFGTVLGGDIILEMHLTPDGKRSYPVQSDVGLIFSKEPPKRLIQTNYFFTKRGNFLVPANVKNHTIQGLFPFQKHVRIESVRGHGHYACTRLKLEKIGAADVTIADLEDRKQHWQLRGETLLEVPNWDFNWQVTYKFKEPLVVLNDEAVLGTGFYDNTEHNLRRVGKGPIEDIVWGQQTFHEMFNVLFLYEELEDDHPLVIEAKRKREQP